MTEDGFLYIVVRLKRIIIRYDGFKVFPSMIEKIIATHPLVKTCCVVGAADKKHKQGKLPIAHIVLNQAYDRIFEIEKEISALCQKELPEYAQPIAYKYHEKLPLTAIGKVDFQALEQETK